MIWHPIVFSFSSFFWACRLFAGPMSWADIWMVKMVRVSMAGPRLMYPIITLLLLFEGFDFKYGFDTSMAEMAFLYAIAATVTSYGYYALAPSIFKGFDEQF